MYIHNSSVFIYIIINVPPKKQSFTVEQEFLLIDAVKSRPYLWDVSHPMYRRTDVKDTLWQEVADVVGPHVTGK